MTLRGLLRPLDFLYRLAIAVRRHAYDAGILPSVHLGPRTISIGNIELGGTGKSPFVAGLVEALLAKGERPVVLARGYRSGLPGYASAMFRGGEVVAIRDSISGDSLALRSLNADEARMISAQKGTVPVIIGANRVAAYRAFKRELADYAPTYLVLDDGFQHLRITRDLDVVLVSDEVGRQSLLPSGNLREPLSALNRASHVVRVTGRLPEAGLTQRDFRIPARALEARIKYDPLRRISGDNGNLPRLPANPVAVCGIARPRAFLEGIRQAGVFPLRVLNLKDHQAFRQRDFSKGFLAGADAIVTTEKDYWRDPQILKSTGLPIWILPMKIDFPYDSLL